MFNTCNLVCYEHLPYFIFILVSYTFTSLFKILSTKMVHELLCEPEAPLRPNFIEKSHCSIETADSLGSLRDNTTLLRYCTPFTIRIPLMIIRFPHYDIVLSSSKVAYLLYRVFKNSYPPSSSNLRGNWA